MGYCNCINSDLFTYCYDNFIQKVGSDFLFQRSDYHINEARLGIVKYKAMRKDGEYLRTGKNKTKGTIGQICDKAYDL